MTARWSHFFRVCLVAVFTGITSVHAAEFLVTNMDEFDAAVPLTQPGDTITLTDGSWTNADLVFRAAGTAENPITLRAQTSGRVILTGTSRLHVGGNHLVVKGLLFTNGYPSSLDVIEFRAGSFNPATECRVTECAIVDFNPPLPDTDTKWVSLYGFSNRLDHCHFHGKANDGRSEERR